MGSNRASAKDIDQMIAIIGDYYIQHNLEDITNCERKPPGLSHLIIIYILFY